MASNDIAIQREHEVFVAVETTKGTLVAPAAGDFIIPVGMWSVNQNPAFTDSEEIQNSRDILEQFEDRMPAGEWSGSIYCRPSGTAGTAPMEDELLQALFGTETVAGGTSVTYSQAIEKGSLSIWVREDHTVKFAKGATVSNLALGISVTGALKFDLSGQFMEMGICGTQDVKDAITALDTTFTVDDASCYSVGAIVEFYNVSAGTTDDNGGAGYTITAINKTTDTLTTSAIVGSFSPDDICRPWTPTGTEVGSPVENRKGVAKIGGVSTNVKTFDITVADPCVYLTEEITTSDYVQDYVEDRRNITGNLSLFFRQNDAKYFIDNVDGSDTSLALVVGDTAGSIVTINMAQSRLQRPSSVDSSPTVTLDMPFTAKGSTGEDSMTIVFT